MAHLQIWRGIARAKPLCMFLVFSFAAIPIFE